MEASPVPQAFGKRLRAAAPELAPGRTASDAIIVENLEKTYPNGTRAVRGVSFRVRLGEVFGIVGPNGAGKSTTIGILGTLVRPTKGNATVLGLDVTKHRTQVRRAIGFAMQEAGVDELATGREFLMLQGRLYGVPKATIQKRSEQLLNLFELEQAGDKRIGSYSGGMKRRIDLASALIHLPKVLFLDEPTEGLDPRSRATMWNTLRRLRGKLNTTIILSTHYMEEADQLCDRIAIIDQGLIVAQDTPAALKASVGGQSVVLDYDPLNSANLLPLAEAALKGAPGVVRLQRHGHQLTAYAADAAEAAPQLLRLLDRAQAAPASLRIQQPTLDDVYLKFTGRKIEEAEAKPTNGGGPA